MLLRNIGRTNCLTYIPQDIKLELDPLNVNVTGSPTISNGVVSGFSSANYLTLPKVFNPQSSRWELVTKFYLTNGGYQYIIGSANGTTSTSPMSIAVGQYNNAHGKLYMMLSSTSSITADICNTIGTTVLQVNINYWIKLVFTGNQYNLYLSTTGEFTGEETLEISINSTSAVYQTTPRLGVYINNIPLLGDGSIDLTQSYIKINDKIWWKGGTGKLTLKKGSKVYIPNGKTEQKYYKYDNSNNPINLADSDNTNLITDGKLVTGYRNDWSTTQTYNINTPLNSNKIYVNINATRCQSSARIITTVTAITNNGEIDIFTKTYGYGATPNETIECSLPNGTITKGFKIFAQIGRKDQIGINAEFSVGVSSNKYYESTSSDYDYVVQAGQNIFDEVVISSDKAIASGWNDKRLIFTAYDGGSVSFEQIVHCHSGNNPPTETYRYLLWYDTSDNLVKYSGDGGESWSSNRYSLPIAVVTTGTGSISSIDQVFNGFGYIGSHRFYLPNIKGLASDGINPDGTYKNVEVTIPKVLIREDTGSGESIDTYNPSSVGIGTAGLSNYIKSPNKPTITYGYWLDTANNIFYNVNNGVFERTLRVPLSKFSIVDGKITSLTPNPVKTTYDYKPCMLHCKVRKYYKYQNWTQPILTSNGTMGGNSFACSQSTYLNDAMAFRCFNGDTTTSGESNRWQINNVNTSTQYWISWYNPKPLKTSSIKVYNNEVTYVVKNWELCGSDDNVNWTTLATGTNTNTTAFSSWTISVPSSAKAYKYFSLGCTPNSTTSMQIGEIQITAKEVVNGTSSNYDYYETETKPYLFARGKRKYYKYKYTNWTQPIMTSNTTYGTLTASVVNSGSGVYQAFDKNTSSWWEAKTGTAEWLNWKLPVTLKITGIKIRVRTGNKPNITCRCYTDSSKKTPIGDSITTTTAGQEIAVANIPSSGIITNNIYFDCSSTQDYMGILEITITAQEQSSVESTIDDYDYYEYESFKLY